MPNGRTHTLINTVVVSSATAAAERLGAPLGDPVVVALLAGAVIGTVFITPDLDMARVRTDARRAWGPFEVLWWPLLKVSRHRGVSHTYLRGPLIRVAYLALMLGLCFLSVRVGWLLTGLPWTPGSWTQVPARWLRGSTLLCALLGYWIAQVLHLLADRIPLTWRRL